MQYLTSKEFKFLLYLESNGFNTIRKMAEDLKYSHTRSVFLFLCHLKKKKFIIKKQGQYEIKIYPFDYMLFFYEEAIKKEQERMKNSKLKIEMFKKGQNKIKTKI